MPWPLKHQDGRFVLTIELVRWLLIYKMFAHLTFYHGYINYVSIFMILTKEEKVKIHYHGNVKQTKCSLGESLVLTVLSISCMNNTGISSNSSDIQRHFKSRFFFYCGGPMTYSQSLFKISNCFVKDKIRCKIETHIKQFSIFKAHEFKYRVLPLQFQHFDSTLTSHMLHVSDKESFEFFLYCETILLALYSAILFERKINVFPLW